MTDDVRASLERALPSYTIGDRLGEGAFGVVFEGRHSQLGRPVAIKQLPTIYAENEGVRERFVAEAQMVAAIDHPHIVGLYDFVESEGARYLIMERCHGSVGDRFKTQGLATDEACAAVLACLAGLDAAHRSGLLHRDVKPENVMYDASGVVKLGDFGIARDTGADSRRTATGMIIGTPAYMSPEQCRGESLTTASDVYSVGIMAYELLTGGLPFPDTESVNGLIAHHLVTEPRPVLAARPELPASIGEVIDRALSKDLSVRQSSAAELARDLARACVTAFGSGWLRRRGFTLHWTDIIAETEQPSSDTAHSDTITVRAGDLTYDALPPPPAVAAVTRSAPQPAVLPEPPVTPSPTPSEPSGSVEKSTKSPGRNRLLIGGIVAALAVIGVAVAATVVLASGGAGGDVTITAGGQASVSRVDDQQPDPGSPVAPTDAPPTATEAAPGPSPTPYLPILTARPADLDMRVAESPFTPTPCPQGPERVACIFSGVAVDDETGEIMVPYFTEGFTPELEPVDYHVHFYLDTVVDGDEDRAGAAKTGGAWRLWDAPFPATTYGGDGGRTLWTQSQFEAVGARRLCALVAGPDHVVIPGTGNCAPLISTSDSDHMLQQLSRLTGQWIGECRLDAFAIVPETWRWYDLVNVELTETARRIAPADAAGVLPALEAISDGGAVVLANGPVADGYAPQVAISVWPGEFALTTPLDQVQAELERLGIDTAGAEVRELQGRHMLFVSTDHGDTVTRTYIVPDYGYALTLAFTADADAGYDELADQIAATVEGC